MILLGWIVFSKFLAAAIAVTAIAAFSIYRWNFFVKQRWQRTLKSSAGSHGSRLAAEPAVRDEAHDIQEGVELQQPDLEAGSVSSRAEPAPAGHNQA